MAETGQNEIPKDDGWGQPLVTEPLPLESEEPEEELLTQEQLQTGALLSIARSFDRIATAVEKWTSQSSNPIL